MHAHIRFLRKSAQVTAYRWCSVAGVLGISAGSLRISPIGRRGYDGGAVYFADLKGYIAPVTTCRTFLSKGNLAYVQKGHSIDFRKKLASITLRRRRCTQSPPASGWLSAVKPA